MEGWPRHLLVVLTALLLAGCAKEQAGSPRPETWAQSDRATSRPSDWTEVEQFRWDGAVLRRGMTRDEVLQQIAKSGGQFGIKRPPPEMIEKNVWQLGCGTSTGAAPGYVAVRLRFHEAKVATIEAYTGPMPA